MHGSPQTGGVSASCELPWLRPFSSAWVCACSIQAHSVHAYLSPMSLLTAPSSGKRRPLCSIAVTAQ